MALNKLALAVLISGRGSNLQALIDASRNPSFPAKINLVISNRSEAQGLQRAKAAGIKAEIIDHTLYPSRDEFDRALTKSLERAKADLLCLAGFMRILGAEFIKRWEGKIINIHPSLLPDYKGQNTHARVLKDNKKESGCSVHYVTAGVDEGPVILQARVPVLADDTPETLAARILEEEHKIYPEAVRLIAQKHFSGV